MAALAAVVWFSCGGLAAAQDLEPRAYANTPVGLNFLVAGYAYQKGDVLTDPGLPIEDGEVVGHALVLAYARSFALLGRSAKFDAIVTHGWVDGAATFQGMPVERRIDGLGDPRFRFSWNLIGAPALTIQEYPSWQQNWLVGISLQIAAPLGQYDPDRLLNIGNGRWAFKPEIGISRALGDFTVEVAPSVRLYTDNDDFFGGKHLEQNPLYAIQGHLIYRFHAAVWGSVDATWYGGGQSTVDGVESDNRQSNARLGATLSVALGRHLSVKGYASTAMHTRRGGDYSILGLALQVRWGGGL